jgi:ribonuclease P protein component
VVHGLPAASPAGSRLAVVVPGRVGTSVARNRIKRTVREAFRLGRTEWRRDWDIVVYVRSLPRPITIQLAAKALDQAVTELDPAFPANG